MQTYLFYDLETTGLSKAFDQILQFAAIRTDTQLNEIERYELKVKLNPACIPSPNALLIHQIAVKETLEGMSEYTAVKQIHQWLNTPGTISLGYNTLNFDDEFLRFSFFRHLLSPYTHQYANQCSRLDIYPMTVMVYLLKPTALEWPEINGKRSFKLSDLNAANQLASGEAHNAMVDVEATVALARKLFQHTEHWDYLLKFFNKSHDQARIDALQKRTAVLVDPIFGFDQNYMSSVYSLGMHRHYKNQSLWLRLDHTPFEIIPPDQLIKTVRVMNKKIGEPGFLFPFKDRLIAHFSKERLSLIKDNEQWLQMNPESLKTLIHHYASYTHPVYPDTDATASLYLNGFWREEETQFCHQFHKTHDRDKAKLLDQIRHPILSVLALRLVAQHFPETLTSAQKERYATLLAKPTVDYKGTPRPTTEATLREIAELRIKNQYNQKQLGLLAELENYLLKM